MVTHLKSAYFLLLTLFFALVFPILPAGAGQPAPRLEGADGKLDFPSAGVINPAAGTIEVTVTPSGNVREMRNDWPFAVQLAPKAGSNKGNTAIGIYCPSGNPEKEIGLRGILRTTAGETIYLSEPESPIRAGEPANLALTWGDGKAVFYRNGRKIADAPFHGEVIDFEPQLQVFARSPFHVSRIRVSAAQLAPGELSADPARPFAPGRECTLLANEFPEGKVFAADGMRQRNLLSLLPFHSLSSRIARENEPILLDFLGNNFSSKPADLPVELTIMPFPGGKELREVRRVTLPPGALQLPVRIDPGRLEAGLYRIGVRVGTEKMPDREIILSILPAPSDCPEGGLAGYLGHSNNRQPEVFRKLNLKWVRAWGHPELNWFQVEPAEGRFDFASADRLIDAYRANGVEVLAVLGYPPLWAAEPPPSSGERAGYRYRRGEPGRWKPRSLAAWDRYVRATADHFRGRIRHYEIYNEVDFHPPGLAESFSGTTEEYFNLLKNASQQLRASDPANLVLVSGFSHTPRVCDMEMPRELVRLGAARYVDIWNVHSYRGKVDMPEMKQLAQSARPGMPIWQTEQMWHVINDPVRRSYLTAAINFWFLELGFDKYFGFSWNPEEIHAFAVSQYFIDRCDTLRGRVKGLPAGEFDVNAELLRRDGSILSVIGSSAGSYRIEFDGEITEARDLTGRKIPLEGNSFRTAGSICYLIGPAPLSIRSAELEAAGELLANPGFDDLVGDDLTGIEQCSFAGWQLRTNYDPGSKIAIRKEGANGRYAAELSTTGKGRVYLFEYLKLPAAGTYRISGSFKNLSGKAKPYLSIFDTTKGSKLLLRKDFEPVSGERFESCVFDVTLDPAPAENIAVIFGIDGAPGSVLLDDVSMIRHTPRKLEDRDAVFPELPDSAPPRKLKSEAGEIDLDLAGPLGSGHRVYGGIPFELSDRWLAAAGEKWSNPLPSAVSFPAARCRKAYLLLAAMYNDPAPGALLGQLRLVYEDGTAAEVPLRNNMELRDWYLADPQKI